MTAEPVGPRSAETDSVIRARTHTEDLVVSSTLPSPIPLHMSPPTYNFPSAIPASHRPPPTSSILEPSRPRSQVLSIFLAADSQRAGYQNLKDNMPDQHAATQGLDRIRKKTLENLNKPLDVTCGKIDPSFCDPKAIRPIVALLRAFVRSELVKNGGQVIRNFWRKFDSWLAARREGVSDDWAGFVDRIIAADNGMHAPPALTIAAENRAVYCCKYAPLCLGGPSGHRHNEPSSFSASPASPSWSARASSSFAGLSSSWASSSTRSTTVLNLAPAYHDPDSYLDMNSDSLPPQTRRKENKKQRLVFILNEER
ncbi:hypothetical protein C8F04DRAFT_1145759 [Mycena alexandri]|uniref:Uncharacterized protein n=1 Tax=Mycena alexandri TaxID=1745969 RepID=A0AAD6WQJ4_9AGAR|nr:hypothetical protein C8F04DRAFT_1145759 [Mycena alexandri]